MAAEAVEDAGGRVLFVLGEAEHYYYKAMARWVGCGARLGRRLQSVLCVEGRRAKRRHQQGSGPSKGVGKMINITV